MDAVYEVVLVVWFATWAIVCGQVAKNKNLDSTRWVVWGAFFGIFAYLVLVSKERRTDEEKAAQDEWNRTHWGEKR